MELTRESDLAELNAGLEPLVEAAAPLELPPPHARGSVLRGEAALLVDGLLTRAAHGRGALDIAMGEVLAALAEGDRTLRLGYSGLGDYARERLGIAPRTALAMVQLAQALRERPLLRQAVRAGEVSARKALAVLPAARGSDEVAWVARARTETVRALEQAVRGDVLPRAPESWTWIGGGITPAGRATLDEALEVAGAVLGACSSRSERLEAILSEYLAAHPAEIRDEQPAIDESRALEPEVRRWLEEETQRWSFLDTATPSSNSGRAGEGGTSDDPHVLDDQLRTLATARDQWDDLVGRLALLVRALGLWRDMQFVSFKHYCDERLGLAVRTVEQRIALERKLHELPSLRTAMREGRVSYEQARVIAEHAEDTSIDALIERAETTLCIALRRELETDRKAQMCARVEIEERVPDSVAMLLEACQKAATSEAGTWIKPAEALVLAAAHFIATWKPTLSRKATPERRAINRDKGFCQVPGCSRAAEHAHHVLYRSRGGADEQANLVSICAAHHLHGIHRGFLRVTGTAPRALTWSFPFPNGGR